MRISGLRSDGVSVVVPVYEEAESVLPLVERLEKALSGREFEVVLVDDGSGQATAKALSEAEERFGFVRVVRLMRHRGKGAALLAGYATSSYPIIVTLDADLQNPPEEVGKLLEALERGADVVVGWRKVREDKWGRRLQGWLFNAALRVLGSPVRDANCGLRAFRREVVESPLCGTSRYRILAPLAMMAGFSVAEVEVRHRKRRWGRSKFGFLRLFAALGDFALLLGVHLTRRRRLAYGLSVIFAAVAAVVLLTEPFYVALGMCFAVVSLILWALAATKPEDLLKPFAKKIAPTGIEPAPRA